MFIIKNNYYLYIENTKDIDINNIKKNRKISIVYRNNKNPEMKFYGAGPCDHEVLIIWQVMINSANSC